MSANNRPNLTEQQRRPLKVEGTSVALSAGAGCGKTTVLTSRFIGALEGRDGVERRPLRSLLALTFTEKAASELRGRIRRESHELLAGANGPEEVRYWRGVLRGLEAAPVSTFHEYCVGLLRRHAFAARLDPDFKVLDANISETVLGESLSRSMRQWLSIENDDLIELAVEYGLTRVRESVVALLRRRGASGLEDWKDRTAEEVLEGWRRGWEVEGKPRLIREFMRSQRECAQLLHDEGCTHLVMRERRQSLLEGFSSIETAAEPGLILGTMLEAARVQGGGKGEDWGSEEVYQEVKERLEKLRKSISILMGLLDVEGADSEHFAAQGLRFVRLAVDARAAYEAAKWERGGLDFDDLLLKSRGLLEVHADEVRNDPGRPLGFILVDEFQDTDPVQDEIIRHLCGDGLADGRLFVVGDFKQSIYRFRGANPELFRRYREEFPQEGRLELTENFRSTTGVIDFVNALFAEAFRFENARLMPGPRAEAAWEGPAVDFVWAEEVVLEGKKGPRAEEQRAVEARWLARLLRGRIEEGWPIRNRASKEGGVRNAHPGDVAFLFRSMTDLKAYEHALKNEGLDFHVVGGKAFYAQQEVQDLVNVLSVVEDPFDAVALAGALRGPFFCLSDDALFWLGGGDTGRGELAEGLARLEEIEALSTVDRDRAARARGLFERWRGLKDRASIAELVDRVLDESGAEAALLGEFLGDRKRANARKLVRLARRFDAEGDFTLGHFVERLREDLANAPREDQAATSDEEGESVRLMTIHQSKGLEFPIVIVPDLNRRPAGDRELVAFDPRLGPLVRPGKSTALESGGDEAAGSGRSLGWDIYRAIEREEERDEALRLFYVATTRARDALILSAGVGADAKPSSAALELLDERFDRSTGVCRKPLMEGWRAPRVGVITECPEVKDRGPRTRKIRPRLRAVARVIETAPMRPEASIAIKPSRPRFIDLDKERGLSTENELVDRIVRAVMAEKSGKGTAEEAVRRAVRKEGLFCSERVQGGAIRVLSAWLSEMVKGELARSTEVVRGMRWTLAWPPEGGESVTVFQGRTELILGGEGGDWRVMNFSAQGAREPVERLRLLLSARAAESVGHGPVVGAWRCGAEGGEEVEGAFGDEVVDEVLREVIEGLRIGW